MVETRKSADRTCYIFHNRYYAQGVNHPFEASSCARSEQARFYKALKEQCGLSKDAINIHDFKSTVYIAPRAKIKGTDKFVHIAQPVDIEVKFTIDNKTNQVAEFPSCSFEKGDFICGVGGITDSPVPIPSPRFILDKFKSAKGNRA